MEQSRNQRNGNMSGMNQQNNAGIQQQRGSQSNQRNCMNMTNRLMQHRINVVNNNSRNENENPQNGNEWSNYPERSMSSNSENHQQNK